MIKGLHHNAYRCRDSEETRQFYEDFLGLPLRQRLRDQGDQERAQDRHAAHLLPLDDGSCLAFFEAPDMPFEFKDAARLRPAHRARGRATRSRRRCSRRARRAGIETRGISDHGFIDSIYFRDPNGYVIELTAKREDHERAMDPGERGRAELERWQKRKGLT